MRPSKGRRRIRRHWRPIPLSGGLGAAGFLGLSFMIAAPGVPAQGVADLKTQLPAIGALEPEAALNSFRLQPGFRIELVASEPLVRDPIAMDFDESGRLFVVEFPEYNQSYRRGEVTARGRVKMLEDTDGDGRMDKSTVYVDKLSFATAVCCYDGGVFVGVAPDLLYCKDTDGDGVADQHDIVLTGFARSVGRAGQAQLNSFRWGLDNRFHVCGNFSGGNVRRARDNDSIPVNIRNRDILFDPRTFEFEAASGGGQHGMAFDDWGRKFTCKNSEPFRLIYYDERYLKNNPYMSAPAPALEITEGKKYTKLYRISPDEPWRVLRTRMRAQGLYRGKAEGDGKPAPSGYFTASTGIAIYRGHNWPKEYRGTGLVGEVSSNILYRAEMVPDGVGLTARRAESEMVDGVPTEFLASTDNWFRPVQLANGPDGALYIADMYRFLIEGAAFLPPEVLRHIDVTAGVERGRIYRVVHEEAAPWQAIDFGKASIAELVENLAHPNAWHRETCSRLIYERQDRDAIPALKALATGSNSSLGRMQAWYSLDGMKALDEETVLLALDDRDSRARQHALRLAEGFVESDAVRSRVLDACVDENLRVRYQAAFSLGALGIESAGAQAAQILLREADDFWMRLAAMSGLGGQVRAVFSRLIADETFRGEESGKSILTDLVQQLAQTNLRADLEEVISLIAALPGKEEALARDLIRSLLRSSGRRAQVWLGQIENERVEKVLSDMIEGARKTALDGDRDAKTRASAVRTLALTDFSEVRDEIGSLLDSRQPQSVQAAALTALRRYDEPEIGDLILGAWDGLSPAMREQAVEIMLSRTGWALGTLDALEAGKIGRGDIGISQVKALQQHDNIDVSRRAREVFAGERFRARDDIVAAYLKAGSGGGKASKGKEIFATICAGCHRLDGVGVFIGAELNAIREREPAEIVLHILDPNREVKPEYMTYLLTTTEGESHAGMITGESANSLTLRRLDGTEVNVLRIQIDALKSMGFSYMPEGLETQIDVDAMADLIEYLTASKDK